MKNFLRFVILFFSIIPLPQVYAQNTQWAFGAGNSSHQVAWDIVLDKDGNSIVVGYFKGSNVDFDPSPKGAAMLSSVGHNDIFVAKYNSLGQYLWAFRLGGSDNDAAQYVTVDSAGNIYVSGWFRGSGVDFDPSASNSAFLNSKGESGNDTGFGGDAFLAKFTSSGTYIWAFNIGSNIVYDSGGDIAIDETGNILWTGSFTGSNVDFDPSDSVFHLSVQGSIETYLAKYSANGQFKTAVRFGGTSVANSGGRAIQLDKKNGIFLTGHFDGTIDLNPGTAVNNFTSSGCGDFFVLKLDTAFNYVWGFKVGGFNCDYVWGMGVDTAQNVYVTGYISSFDVDFNPGSATNLLSTKGADDIFVAKYDKNGNYIFANSMGSNIADQAFGITVHPSGYTITGGFSGTVDFDPGTSTFNLSGGLGGDIFVSQFDLNGKHKSSFRIGKDSSDIARNITSNTRNEILIVGSFEGSNVDFDPSASKLLLSSKGGSDLFVAKYTNLDLVNKITGSIYIDRNKNGIKDSSEIFFTAARIISIKENVDTIIGTTSSGHFSFNVDTGRYITHVKSYAPYYNIVPQFDTTSFSSYLKTDTVLFALQPKGSIRDLAIAVIPLTPARPGFETRYKVVYVNKGTDTVPSGSVQFIKPQSLTLISSNQSSNSVTGDTLSWTYNNLKPLDTASIFLTFRVAAPPSVNNGDTISTTAIIYPVASDSTPADNVSHLRMRVVGSYDPNDKMEKHAGSLRSSEVNSDYLQYTIRFQNTGTDTAFNVNIRDTLSTELDWTTLEMISSSHNYQLNIEDGNKLMWRFDDIKLVDSIKNEPLSHGHLVFRIKPAASFMANDTIKNHAAIYFDYNLPVITNTSVTTVETTSLPLKILSFNASKNGKQNILKWFTASELNTRHFEVQRSSDGLNFKLLGIVAASGGTNALGTYEFRDDQPGKPVNYYRLKIVDKDGKSEYSATKKINNSQLVDFTIYPNPVTDNLFLKINSEINLNVDVRIVDIKGRIVSSANISTNAGSAIKSFDVTHLSIGSYFLQFQIRDQQTSLKFEKIQ